MLETDNLASINVVGAGPSGVLDVRSWHPSGIAEKVY